MAATHRLLARQIRRHLGGADAAAQDHLADFLDAVNRAYLASDEDRELLERAMAHSSDELIEATDELRAVLRALPDELLTLSETGKVLHHKAAAEDAGAVCRGSSCSPVGQTLEEVLGPLHAARMRAGLAAIAAGAALETFELRQQGAPGAPPVVYEVRMVPLHGGRTVAMLRDISARKSAEQRIARLAYHDSLTGLPNRLSFQLQVSQGIDRAQELGMGMGLIFLDVDHFKAINDTFGHAVGDQLLITLAHRLRAAVHTEPDDRFDADRPFLPTAPPAAGSRLISRMGGDEFTVLMHDLEDEETARAVAERIIEVMTQPIVIDGVEVVTSFSLGLSIYPQHGQDVATLLRAADAAMYHAKASGRANAQVFTTSIDFAKRDQVELLADLRRAIRSNQLELAYQPLVSAETGRTHSLEALARWRDPVRGMVSPGVFIPLAEESDLILELGHWAVHRACAQLRQWLDAGLAPPRVSVNLSSHHFTQGDVVGEIREALEQHRVPAALLGIELTETAMVRDTERTARALQGLRELGVTISLDDFGTGYASLSYLKRFPVDVLKIDASFVHNLMADAGDAALVRAIVAMGHGLGLRVVAEGVETCDQYAFLEQLGCNVIQGYLLGRPTSPELLAPFLGDDDLPALVCGLPRAKTG